ncbi:MAG: hypothetical protein GC159_20360 [Phycisphaera sp.]|nr:hypothetical protein [Phycisphaera sp.]
MNTPPDQPDHPELIELLTRLVDGEFSDGDAQRLEGILQDRPDLRAYYIEYINTWAMLDAELAPKPVALTPPTAIEMTDEASPAHESHATPRRTFSVWSRRVAIAAALLIVASIGITLLVRHSARQVDAPSVDVATPNRPAAMLAYAEDARWAPDAAPEETGEFQSNDLHLRSGSAQIMTGSGAVVTLQGETDYHVTDEMHGRLDRGRVTVYVPPRAHGFTVDAGSARIVDLGTEFAVELDANGDTQVHVMRGHVEVRTPNASRPVTLEAQQAIRVVGVGNGSTTIPFAPQQYTGWTSKDETVAATDGAVELLPYSPRTGRQVGMVTGSHIYLVPEAVDPKATLGQIAALRAPGAYARFDNMKTRGLGNASGLRSYLLHFQPGDGADRLTPANGSVTFDRPILAVIVDGASLDATDAAISQTPIAVRANFPGRGLESPPDGNADRVTISNDRRTLTVSLRANGMDQLRVILADQPEN